MRRLKGACSQVIKKSKYNDVEVQNKETGRTYTCFRAWVNKPGFYRLFGYNDVGVDMIISYYKLKRYYML